MGAWLKMFYDGSMERGSDEDIAKKLASWTWGRLDGIREVRLFNIKRTASLSVPSTSWHQFDRLTAIVAANTTVIPEVTHRVVQAEIQPHHVGQTLVCSHSGINFFWAVVRRDEAIGDDNFRKLVTERHVGKWLTLILPEKDYPIVHFSTKGKMYDNQHIPRQRN